MRNLVRGLLSGDNSGRTFERLRKECPAAQVQTLVDLLFQSQFNSVFDLPIARNDALERIRATRFFTTARLDFELARCEIWFREHQQDLVSAIRLLEAINLQALEGDFERAEQLLGSFVQDFGISLTALFKALSCRNSAKPRSDGKPDFNSVVAPFLSPHRELLAVAFEDSIDQNHDYLRVRRSYLDFVSAERVDPSESPIIFDMYSPRHVDREIVAQRLQAFGRWGAIDSLFCLMRQSLIAQHQGDGVLSSEMLATVPNLVRECWEEAFKSVDLNSFVRMIGASDQFFEREVFAHAFAWSEYPDILNYRMNIEQSVGGRLDGIFPTAGTVVQGFCEPVDNVSSLMSEGSTSLDISRINPGECGAFHRTVALVTSIEDAGVTPTDGRQLCLLLDETIDVANMLSPAELKTFLPPRPSDLLYSYLRSALLHDQEPTKVSNYALRRALQKLVRDDFDGSLVDLIKHLDSKNGHVSTHLFNMCSESFLTELYQLYELSDEVTEAQTTILEWRGQKKDDPEAALRAKSQRLNLRLRKVRGAIEETRIYVDPLRFLDWIQDQKSSELRALAGLANEINSDSSTSVSLQDQLKNKIEPRLRLLKLLDDCYQEFCTNKIYGVTSFIGRRIRHGTLHGHLVLEIRPLIQKTIDQFRMSAPQFGAWLENWYREFDRSVKLMAADEMHVRSKDHQQGLIIARLDEPQKVQITTRMLSEIGKSLVDRPGIAATMAAIQEYCWLAFEVDLKRARNAVEQLRRAYIIPNDQHVETLGSETGGQVGNAIRQINGEVQRRFEIVQAWLTRPSNLSPSATVEMLVQAVLNEIQQRYENFRPNCKYSCQEEIDLLGHRFHFFYDALYILVDNAAKHGRADGDLEVTVSVDRSDSEYVDLVVEIRSDLQDVSEAAEKINFAMSAEVGDAMVENRQSGIRKLRGLVENVEEIRSFSHSICESNVSFAIEMRYLSS